jgi:hypothetical protein
VNRVGVVYSLTVIAPIVGGREQEAREAIEAPPADFLARLESLHFSRIHVVSELVFQGPQQRWRDELQASHVVFTSTFDGELEPYLEEVRSCADTWWRFCAGYPGGASPEFARWVRAHQIDSNLFASAHPEATVPAVLGSLALRERIVDFAVQARRLEPAELQRRFRDEFVV